MIAKWFVCCTSRERLFSSRGEFEAIVNSQKHRITQAKINLPPAILLLIFFYYGFREYAKPSGFIIWVVLACVCLCARYLHALYLSNKDISYTSITSLLRNEYYFFILGLFPQIVVGVGYWVVIPSGSVQMIFGYVTMASVYALGTAGTLVRVNYLPLFILLNLGSGTLYLLFHENISIGLMLGFLSTLIVRSNENYKFYILRTEKANDEIAYTNLKLKHVIGDKNRFVDSVTHDLLQPSTALIWSAQSIRYEEDMKEVREIARGMEVAAVQLKDQIKTLGSMSFRDQVDPVISECDVAAIARTIVNIENNFHSNPSVALVLDSPESVPCLTDQRMLYTLLSNLINNACKYTKVGMIVVRLTQDEFRDEVTVTVTDTGVGIPDDLKSKIFREGFQARDNLEGAGLGLFSVKEYCDAMGAILVLKSQVGVGSMFRVTLPRGFIDASEPEAVDIADLRLLLVDDNDASRNSLLNAFEERGCIVSSFKTPLSAIYAVSNREISFDYAVIDYMLEDARYNGCDLAARLGIDKSRVSIVSATQNQEIMDSIREKYDLRSKPLNSVEMRDLCTRIQSAGSCCNQLGDLHPA